MANAIVDALVPIFAGLLLGFGAGRRGLMDNLNVRNLIALVMSISAPSALFLIIINTSRTILRQQIWTSLAIALTFAVLYVGFISGHGVQIQSPKALSLLSRSH